MNATISPPRSRWRTRVLLPLVLLASLVGLILYAGRAVLRPAIPVRVAPVIVKEVEGSAAAAPAGAAVQAPGWLEADPYAVDVPALADGVVREVLALDGAKVEAGQVVARLVDEDAKLALARAEAELAVRRALVEKAKADRDAAQRTWDNPIERTRAKAAAKAAVDEAQALAARADAEVTGAQAGLEAQREELARITPLTQQKLVSDVEFIHMSHKVQEQVALLVAAESKRPEAAAKLAAARAELAAAERGAELRIEETRALAGAVAALAEAEASVKLAEAARDEGALRQARMEVKSPVTGTVSTVLVEPGSRVMTSGNDARGAWVVRLYDPAKLQARVDVPLAEAAKIAVGQAAEVQTEALPGKVFKGHVTRLVHSANIEKNTVQVKVAIEEPAEAMRPEMLARVRIFAQAPGSAGMSMRLLAPRSAITDTGEGHGDVWVCDAAGEKAERRRVTLGAAVAGDSIEVVGGLNPGDRVIVDAPPRLTPGARVRIVEGGR